MKQRSLLSIVLGFIFSIAGLCSNGMAVMKGDIKVATIAAFIYVFPLSIDAVEELSAMYIVSMHQYRILRTSVCVGGIYLLLILAYWALHTLTVASGSNLFRAVLALLPAIFSVSKIYDLRIALKQNGNVAKAYCKED